MTEPQHTPQDPAAQREADERLAQTVGDVPSPGELADAQDAYDQAHPGDRGH